MVMSKEYKQTDDVTILKELISFLDEQHNKAQTKGDLLVLKELTMTLYETIAFYNEDDEEIDIINAVKEGGRDERNI